MMKLHIKPVGKQVSALTRHKMGNVRAELDNLISNINSFSDVELEQAKAKLMENVASVKRAAKDVIVDARGKRYSAKPFDYIALASLLGGAVVWYLRSSTLSTTACLSDLDQKNCLPPKCWCNPYTLGGSSVDGRCSDPKCDACNEQQGKYPDYTENHLCQKHEHKHHKHKSNIVSPMK
jgi:hypothetical protein